MAVRVFDERMLKSAYIDPAIADLQAEWLATGRRVPARTRWGVVVGGIFRARQDNRPGVVHISREQARLGGR